MSNILVTGAGGFIGEWVVKELQGSSHRIIPFLGDITDKSSLANEQVDVVIHLAARVTHRGQVSPEELYRVNVLGTKNLLEAYPEAKMVYISTVDVLREKFSEYAKTKSEAEKIVSRMGKFVILRLPSVFGPAQRQKKLIPLLFVKYCSGGACTIQNNDIREYIYVHDAAKQIVSSMNKAGIIRLEGFKISNLDLEAMIRAVCRGEKLLDAAPDREYFFCCLKQCLPTYRGD